MKLGGSGCEGRAWKSWGGDKYQNIRNSQIINLKHKKYMKRVQRSEEEKLKCTTMRCLY